MANYIQNAGLVILAPFLPKYFTMLEMTADEQFLNEATAVRGVQLLHYLVTGQTDTPEDHLVLNKILCGVHLSTFVDYELVITEHEVEVSRQLLNAVLQNWDKMSNSTVENLRASFLLREGLIVEHSAYWSLKVTSAGYDILLSFLPWNISVFSSPWMEKRMEVDWISTTA